MCKDEIKQFAEVTGFSENFWNQVIWAVVVVLALLFISLMDLVASMLEGINYLN
jgi:hypothetical protein